MDRYEDNLGYFNRTAAREHPDRIAVVDLSRSKPLEISHAALDARMDCVAAALQHFGMRCGDRLLLAMGNRSEFIEAFFGAMRAGVVPIPLNYGLGTDTIRFIVRDSGARAAIVECRERIQMIVEEAGLTPRIATAPAPDGWQDYETVLGGGSEVIPPEISPRQVAFLPYTSGSTGRPKGVMLPHGGMLWGIRAAQRYWPASPDDRALIAGPLFHKNAMRVSVKPKLRVGGSVAILPRFEPCMFLRALAECGCTHAGGVPAMYRLALAERELLAGLRFPRLRSLEMGSAVVGADLIRDVETAFGAPVHEAYGLTEGGGPLREPVDGETVPRGSCGLVAPEVEVRLVGEDGRDNPRHGELWVRSPAVLVGYNNRPDLDAERLVDGFLRTGDIFRRDENGFFYFMGRIDDQFSCGGENIYPKEVELLLAQHPDVIDAVVAPVAHAVKGLAPAALVVLREVPGPGEEALRRFALERGPAYAHPRRIFSVAELPLNGAGKVDRPAARAQIEARIGGVLGAQVADRGLPQSSSAPRLDAALRRDDGNGID